MPDISVPPKNKISAIVSLALTEDIGTGDITAALISKTTYASAKIIAREPGIICGRPWAEEVCAQIDSDIEITWLKQDGDAVAENQTIAQFKGPARALLTAERSLLNFLQTLSGVATKTNAVVNSIKNSRTAILDTRKTLPGLRVAQKYAVTVGGGVNHRMGLYDAYLIKENHISACGGIDKAIKLARELAPEKPIEIEVQTNEQLLEAIASKADIVMLDNFSIEESIEAVAINASRVKLEASGNITDETIASVADTGVDFISIGALTKHCKALDLSMLFD